MIKSKFLFAALMLCSTIGLAASGTTAAPFTNPGYTPNFVTPSYTLPTGAQVITLPTFGSNTLAVNFSGTCTSLAGTAFGSTDNGSTWTQINVYPYPAVGTAAPTVSGSGALVTGLQKFNTGGFTKIKLNISALAGTSCVFSAAQTTGSYDGSIF